MLATKPAFTVKHVDAGCGVTLLSQGMKDSLAGIVGNIAFYVATDERRRMSGANRRQHHADRKNAAEDFGYVVVLD
ncbi:hypothetical protein [Rhizobium sp. G21]|uniref:hypothetical protein n=1 Tax=Rhizobium sp. G21 TaxID=2758439 RepID=UPI0016029421|nr:hypothetical protein [Rhizobium sp. G21]MBB1248816.1 hypothetical protein [Rhizobium sp. G21]